jgi:hypothetical protein
MPAIVPRGRAAVLRDIGNPDAFAAFLALSMGFSLVGVVLVVAFPLVALASFGWTILQRSLQTGPRRG